MSELTAKAPASTWLTVTEAARRLGISERAVQRRCKSGKLCAELVPTPTGHQWQIAADALDNEPMCHDSADASDSDSRDTSDIRAATAVEQETTLPTAATATAPTVPIPEAATHTTAPTPGPDAVLIEELRDQVKYLRSALEARDRDAAELRAALRDALKMSARALTDGSDRQVLAEAAQKDRKSVV